jgi:hypothetical protein
LENLNRLAIPLPVVVESDALDSRTLKKCSVEAAWHYSGCGVPRKLAGKKKYTLDRVVNDWDAEKHYRRSTGRSYTSAPIGHIPVLKIRSYAHDRVVLTCYRKPPAALICQPKKDGAKEIIRGSGNFSLIREVQSGLKIAGRWRSIPTGSSFTVHGRNMVRDAGHIVEHYSSGLCLFGTLTIAGDTDEIFKTVAIASPVITNRLTTWLRTRVLDGNYVFVWELQQRGAPHLHYLFRVPRDIDLVAFGKALRTEWRKILLDISAETMVDLFRRRDGGTWRDDRNKPRVNLLIVKHDYGRYIAKYASKVRTKGGKDAVFCPSRWWGVSVGLRRRIRDIRLEAIIQLPTLSASFEIAETFGHLDHDCTKNAVWLVGPVADSFAMLSFFCPPKKGRMLVLALLTFLETGSLSCLDEELKRIKSIADTS